MALNTLLVGLVSAITFSDSTAVGQFMISRPIVSAPLMGLLLGDIQTGIFVGILLELLWVGTLPVGAFVPPESTFAAVNTVAIAVLTDNVAKGDIILIFLLLTPFTFLARFLEDKIRSRNNALSKCADRAVIEGRYGSIQKLHFLGLSMFFIKTFLVSSLAVALGVLLVPRIVELVPINILDILSLGGDILPLIGVAVVIDLLLTKNNWWYPILGFMLAFFVHLWVVTLVSLGLVIIFVIGRIRAYEG